jgi:nonsense-mediated mRNA decay protein 3
MDLNVCPKCNAVKIGSKWYSQDMFESAIHRTVIANIEKSENITDFDCKLSVEKSYEQCAVKAEINFSIGKISATRLLCTKIRLKRISCDMCSKFYGGYYEAIVQIRATRRKLGTDEIIDIENFVDAQLACTKDVFVSKHEYRDGGIDLYLSDKRFAKALAQKLSKKLGATFKQSAKLHTRKCGKNVYRMTYLVRIRSKTEME